jgi:hypothetical protein
VIPGLPFAPTRCGGEANSLMDVLCLVAFASLALVPLLLAYVLDEAAASASVEAAEAAEEPVAEVEDEPVRSDWELLPAGLDGEVVAVGLNDSQDRAVLAPCLEALPGVPTEPDAVAHLVVLNLRLPGPVGAAAVQTAVHCAGERHPSAKVQVGFLVAAER